MTPPTTLPSNEALSSGTADSDDYPAGAAAAGDCDQLAGATRRRRYRVIRFGAAGYQQTRCLGHLDDGQVAVEAPFR